MEASARPAADYAQVIATAHRLHSSGGRLGVATILFNASLAAQREAAEARDLPERPAFGRRLKTAEKLDPANENHPDTSTAPAPIDGGL